MTASPTTALRYTFSGHAIGAAARFHRLDEVQNLKHVVPTLGASVVPETGGISKQTVENYTFDVEHPRKRSLLSLNRAETTVEGRDPDGRFETELEVVLEQLRFVEKLHIDSLRLHLLAIRDGYAADSVISTKGNQIEGMRLGKVEAKISFDDEAICATGTAAKLAEFYQGQSDAYRKANHARFNTPEGTPILARHHGDHHKFSLVHKIELIGEESDKVGISVDGNMIHWKGFGRIFLGEVYVRGNERKISMVRLAMGSDAGGDGTAGQAKSNGDPVGP